MNEVVDPQGKMCAAILTEMRRCGIDARYESTKIQTVTTISRGWRDDLVDLKKWSHARNCWFGISFRLSDAERLLAELRSVGDGAVDAARTIYDNAARRIVERS
jgi:hypothetical protein